MDDEILEINGRGVEGMTANEVADMMVIVVVITCIKNYHHHQHHHV